MPNATWLLRKCSWLRGLLSATHCSSLPYRKPSSIDPKHPRAQCSAPVRTVLKMTHSLWQYSRVPPNSGVNCCSSMYVSRSLTELSITTYKQGNTVSWLIIASTQVIRRSSLQTFHVSENGLCYKCCSTAWLSSYAYGLTWLLFDAFDHFCKPALISQVLSSLNAKHSEMLQYLTAEQSWKQK